MASEAVNAVISAEQECDDKIAKAENDAAIVISSAEKKAAEIVDAAVAQAKIRSQTIIGDAEKKAAEIISDNGNNTSDFSVDRNRYKSAVEAVRAKALELQS